MLFKRPSPPSPPPNPPPTALAKPVAPETYQVVRWNVPGFAPGPVRVIAKSTRNNDGVTEVLIDEGLPAMLTRIFRALEELGMEFAVTPSTPKTVEFRKKPEVASVRKRKAKP